jgi:glyoxylase-like metal-dependent hydrolase (beta-lactamase superfamily II)
MSTRWSRAFRYSVSAYLARGVLIDAGFPDVAHDVAALLDRTRPAGIVLTHHHEDHAGNLTAIAARGLPIAASPLTRSALRTMPRAGFYRRVVWGTMPPAVDPLDGLLPSGLALIPTPGHSPDHHAVWDAEHHTLFAGDLFVGVKVRATRPEEDPRVHVRSLRAAAALRPRTMFDAHRGLVPDPVAALTAKADWMDDTIATIDRLVSEGWSDAAITRTVLGHEHYVAYFSLGDLSRRNFVRTVRTSGAPAPSPVTAVS